MAARQPLYAETMTRQPLTRQSIHADHGTMTNTWYLVHDNHCVLTINSARQHDNPDTITSVVRQPWHDTHCTGQQSHANHDRHAASTHTAVTPRRDDGPHRSQAAARRNGNGWGGSPGVSANEETNERTKKQHQHNKTYVYTSEYTATRMLRVQNSRKHNNP